MRRLFFGKTSSILYNIKCAYLPKQKPFLTYISHERCHLLVRLTVILKLQGIFLDIHLAFRWVNIVASTQHLVSISNCGFLVVSKFMYFDLLSPFIDRIPFDEYFEFGSNVGQQNHGGGSTESWRYVTCSPLFVFLKTIFSFDLKYDFHLPGI